MPRLPFGLRPLRLQIAVRACPGTLVRHRLFRAYFEYPSPRCSIQTSPPVHVRSISSKADTATSPLVESPAPLTIEQYHKLSDAYIETLLTDFEELQEENEEVDVEYSAGVLNLKMPDKGTYVINKQPPNKQIWLSSPVSGPKRFDYVLPTPITEASEGSSSEIGGPSEPIDQAAREDTTPVEGGEWIYLRDGTGLSDLLREELGVELAKIEEI